VYGWVGRIPSPAATERDALALPPDSAISPLDAGRALLLLEGLTPRGRRPSALPEQRLPTPLPPLPGAWPADPHDSSAWRDLPNPAWVLAQAVRGFTTPQLAWLRALDAHPVWAVFHTVATAPAIDYFGARFRLPLPEVVPAEAIETPWFFGLRRLAYYNTARAALRLAERRPADAERILRETVSLGRNVTLTGGYGGSQVTQEGRRALGQFARLSGRAVPGLAQARDTTTAAAPEPLTGASTTAAAATLPPRASALAAALDGQWPRSARFWVLGDLARFPCTNVRELAFGPDKDLLAAFDAARRALARFPFDSARIDALERIAKGAGRAPALVDRADNSEGASLLYAVGSWAGRASARILGVPRISSCFDLIMPMFLF
jgi:hypothetical protein